MEILKNRDVVFVGLVAYNAGYGNNAENIAIEFSKHNRVLYVNPPLDRNTILKKREKELVEHKQKVLKGDADDLVKISDNFWVFTPRTILESINWIPFAWLHTLLNRINNGRYARQIKAASARLGFKDLILFNDNDIFRSFFLKEMLKPSLYVYYIRDNLTVMHYWKKQGQRLEPKLFAKSDLVVANSTYLAAYGRNYNQKSYYVGQGCDLTLFDGKNKREEPNDIKSIPHPRIGYVGNMTAVRLDIDLLIFIAKQKPEWNLVLVGPEDDTFKASALHQLPNVHFLGMKKMEVLADYISYFDVCINPQVNNPVTIGNYPRKIDEYLGMGKPLVATKTMAMEAFAAYTYLAETNDDYITLINQALVENDTEKMEARIKFAAEHTWENNVLAIYKEILQVLKEN